MQGFKRFLKLLILAGITGAAAWFALHVEPVAQDPEYHNFIDQRRFYGIDNFYDVASNLAFIIAALCGFHALKKRWDEDGAFRSNAEKVPAAFVFAGVFATAIGSAWYHLSPDNASLVWDRLAMSVGFMSLFTLMIAERWRGCHAFWMLPLFIAAGIGSVLYWHMTESAGMGDLRPYAFVQYLPAVLLPLIWLMFRNPYTATSWLWVLYIFYVGSKLLEFYDIPVFELSAQTVSGHSLKHIASALAAWALAHHIAVRKLRGDDPVLAEKSKPEIAARIAAPKPTEAPKIEDDEDGNDDAPSEDEDTAQGDDEESSDDEKSAN